MRSARLVLVLALMAAFLAGIFASPASGFSNGQLPESALSKVATGVPCSKPGDELANKAAAGYNSMALSAGRNLGDSGCMSAYRSLAGQQYLYTHCPAICAVPGTSNHGLGEAVDMLLWVRQYTDTTHGAFGFDKACSDAPSEWWHVTFCSGQFHRPNPGVNLNSPVLRNGSGGPGQGPWVRKAQRLLRKHGDTHLTIDGSYGPRTHRAVSQFQRAAQIKTTGVVSHKTWEKLRAPIPQPRPKPQRHENRHHSGQHVASKAASRAPPAAKVPIQGVDVSANNGPVHFHDLRQAGARFVYVKATEGQDYLDPLFGHSELHRARHAGLVVGAYHFLHPYSWRPGAREGRFFVQALQQAGYGHGFLRPVADIEATSLDPHGTCRYLHSFVHRVRGQLHVKPIIYTYPGFAQTNFAGCAWITNFPLWIANYGVSAPAIAPWGHYLIWQYTGSGSLGGLSPIDRNVLPAGLTKLHRLQMRHVTRRHPHAKVADAQPIPKARIHDLTRKAPLPRLRPNAETTPSIQADLHNLLLDLIGAPR